MFLTSPAVMLSLFFGFAQIRADAIPDGIMPKDKRQAGTGVTTSTTPATSDTTTQDTTPTSTPTSTPQTTPTSTPQSTSTPDDTTSTRESSSESSPASSSQRQSSVPSSVQVTTTNSDGSSVTSRISTSALSTSIISSGSGTASNQVVIGSSTINRSTLSSATVITTPLIAQETEPVTSTSYWTSDGTVHSSLITSNKVVSSTTGFATATISPTLQNGGSGGSSLSDSSKKIIGGVVGGVGGAILVGGLALVAWRLWGKKKRQKVPQDDMMDSANDSIHKDHRTSGPPGAAMAAVGDYRNPNGSVNTASNF